MKRLPAFGKEVRNAIKEGLRPKRALYVVRSWPKDEVPLWTIVVPSRDDPYDFDLSLCRGLSVWVRLPLVAFDNAGLIMLIEAADPLGGVISIEGSSSCGFIDGTLARARLRE
jgi:hypothetical protein